MLIGDAARGSGVSAKMVRHYEAIGILPPAGRRANTYRDYDAADVHRLRFVRRARKLGFSMEQVRELLRLWNDRCRSNADVKRLALAHVGELEARIGEMQEMAATLRGFADACDGSGRPECPILAGLEGRVTPDEPRAA